MRPYLILFAGVPGTSKTPIAYYLSERFGLPMFNTDNLRYEVREDLLVDDINIPHALKEFEKRYERRFREMLDRRGAFIYDGSIDRKWPELSKRIHAAGYRPFIISMELSRPFIEELYRRTGRASSLEYLDNYLRQHQEFLEKYSSDINLRLTDNTFKDRLKIAAKEVEKFIKDMAKN